MVDIFAVQREQALGILLLNYTEHLGLLLSTTAANGTVRRLEKSNIGKLHSTYT